MKWSTPPPVALGDYVLTPIQTVYVLGGSLVVGLLAALVALLIGRGTQ